MNIMMKKTLIMASVIALTMSSAAFAGECTCGCDKGAKMHPRPPHEFKNPEQKVNFEKKREEFESRLQLTDKQKEQAKVIREKGREEIKPVMDKIKAKYEEIQTVKRSRITVEAQNERINALNEEISALKKYAGELRKKNMEEFENILTRNQKKELTKMKEEGRKKFEERKNKPGFPPPPPPTE